MSVLVTDLVAVLAPVVATAGIPVATAIPLVTAISVAAMLERRGDTAPSPTAASPTAASPSTTDPTRPAASTPTLPTTMPAAVQRRYASVDHIAVEDVPVPTPAAGEVLVEVAAAGVDRGVWHLATGRPYLVRLAGYGLRRPSQPVQGLDVAGTVVAVGEDVDRFQIGDEVYGIGNGTYARFAAVRADKLALRPSHISPVDAATIAVSGSTAIQALVDHGGARAGDRVLVVGASGGVGSWATRIARALDMHVTGVASAAKAEFVRSLGAEIVLDHAVDRFEDEEPFDVIVDCGGRNPLRRLRSALSPTGTLVIVGGEGGGSIAGGIGRQIRATLRSPFTRQRLRMMIADERAEAWSALAGMIERGGVAPAASETYELGDVARALGDLEAGRIVGKAAIRIPLS